MIELHELVYSDVFAERDELLTEDGDVILKGGVNVFYEDICKTITPLKDELNFKENSADKNVRDYPVIQIQSFVTIIDHKYIFLLF